VGRFGSKARVDFSTQAVRAETVADSTIDRHDVWQVGTPAGLFACRQTTRKRLTAAAATFAVGGRFRVTVACHRCLTSI